MRWAEGIRANVGQAGTSMSQRTHPCPAGEEKGQASLALPLQH